MTDYGHELEFGVFATPSAQSVEGVLELAALADRAGLDVLTFQDHPYQPRFLDTWTLLSFVAARTRRVRLAANVLNVPLRPPAVVARAAASLDRLSGGRVELGLGAGAFPERVEGMGGRRLSPGQRVEALEEAIDVIRELWALDAPAAASFEGRHYRLEDAERGPAPAHPIGIWVGAYKPRMLSLTGRKADGWLPSLPYLGPGDLTAGNAAIDEAAEGAGRDPGSIRRLLNLPVAVGEPARAIDELTRLALDEGVSTFLLMADDPDAIRSFAAEIAPAVRERVASERHGRTGTPAGGIPPGPAPDEGESEYDRLGVTPTPDPGIRLAAREAWDESSRPHRPGSAPGVTYTDEGRQLGRHLIDVHDLLRRELTELRGIVEQVREGALGAGSARSALNEMALRQNDWTLGAFCARYCAAVAGHHGLEDDAVFPHLSRSEPSLEPVIDRLAEEHLVIHDAIQEIDRALVHHLNDPSDLAALQSALDFLTDALLSHLSYEELELVEPLARLGFYPGQVAAP